MCRNSWAFPVSGHMTVLSIPGYKVILTVTWSITAHSSPVVCMRGDALIGVEVGFLMFATWFSMSSCPWICLSRVL